MVEPGSRRVARRQRDAADDWVRFKTPAWRTSCINRSFSCRTANNEMTSLTIIVLCLTRRRIIAGNQTGATFMGGYECRLGSYHKGRWAFYPKEIFGDIRD